VTVVHPKEAPEQTSLSLPGNLEPMYSASVYARANGYIEKRFVDIGTHVKAGQLLAIIATPEIDQQLNQARCRRRCSMVGSVIPSRTRRADYDGMVANYRQTALEAFQQVEDNLAALCILQRETDQQYHATTEALESLDTFQARYAADQNTRRWLGYEVVAQYVIESVTKLKANRSFPP
jgi:multidrug efflux pump subunit AcrA (membrane-fusion protein)